MSITLVLHEATRTGAPRVGALIAKELASDEDVHVLVLKDGPLTPWLRELLGDGRLTVLDGAEFDFHLPFEDRLKSAAALLEKRPDDLVYVNSLAASVSVLAAKARGRARARSRPRKPRRIVHLMRHVLTRVEVIASPTARSGGGRSVSRRARRFRHHPGQDRRFRHRHRHRGRARAGGQRRRPPSTPPASVSKGKRLVVGMCGHTSPRKGSDIFLTTGVEVMRTTD